RLARARLFWPAILLGLRAHLACPFTGDPKSRLIADLLTQLLASLAVTVITVAAFPLLVADNLDGCHRCPRLRMVTTFSGSPETKPATCLAQRSSAARRLSKSSLRL